MDVRAYEAGPGVVNGNEMIGTLFLFLSLLMSPSSSLRVFLGQNKGRKVHTSILFLFFIPVFFFFSFFPSVHTQFHPSVVYNARSPGLA